jgi:hypothetical protein
LPFKRLGVIYALPPAALYALANVEMFRHFAPNRMPLPPSDSPLAELMVYLGMNRIMWVAAFLLILSTTYMLGLMMWGFTKLLAVC